MKNKLLLLPIVLCIPFLLKAQSNTPAELFELTFKEGEPYISQLYGLEEDDKYCEGL